LTEFKKMRLAAGLTQQAAADLIGAPLRTLQSWEQEHGDSGRTCPPYVLALIHFKLAALGKLPDTPE
jgi:DNA-binding XRE family transcriptional regulator